MAEKLPKVFGKEENDVETKEPSPERLMKTEPEDTFTEMNSEFSCMCHCHIGLNQEVPMDTLTYVQVALHGQIRGMEVMQESGF